LVDEYEKSLGSWGEKLSELAKKLVKADEDLKKILREFSQQKGELTEDQERDQAKIENQLQTEREKIEKELSNFQ
jgi:hypothetical protein